MSAFFPRPGGACRALAIFALTLVLWTVVVPSLAWAGNKTLIPLGAAWRFLPTGEGAPPSWVEPQFDDSAWVAGVAKIGVGHQDNTTSLPAPTVSPRITVYFRKKFSHSPDTQAVSGLLARMACDAGAIVYLNGMEAGRLGMPAGAIDSTTLANAEPIFPLENSLQNMPLDHSLLIPGENTIAIELHASSAIDPDLTFDMELVSTNNPAPAFVIRGPYLQNAAPDAVTIRWRTNVATPTEVRAGISVENLQTWSATLSLKTEHEARLVGLAPDTEYFYAIANLWDTIEGPGAAFRFRTPPLRGTVKPVRVWVLGDCGQGRSGTGNAEAVRDGYLNSPLYRTPDVWLMLGDNAYYSGTDAEYQNAVFDTFRGSLRQSVLWSTLGNHETYSPDVPYFSIFTLPAAGEGGGIPSGTEHYYSFDYANIHFVCLDSMQSARIAPSAMLSWLEADLATTTQSWIVAFWHHPPYTKGTHDSDAEIEHIEMRENVLPILEEYGVDLVLGGHSHTYERSYLVDGEYGYSWELDSESILDAGSGRADEPDGAYGKDPGPNNGAVYCVTGSSGQPGGGSLNHPLMYFSSAELGSLIFDVDGDRLDAKFISPQGVIRDYFTISKAPLVTVSAPQPSLAEGSGGPATVRLVRSRETDRALPVQLALSGSAAAGNDYAAPLFPAMFPAGQTSVDLHFSALTDSLAEGAESIVVSMLAGSGYRLPKFFRSVTLSLSDRPLDAWRFEKFDMFANDLSIAGDAVDADSDGQNNLAEYLAGTEPLDAASTFAASVIRNASGQFVVRFLASKGRSYKVFHRPSFSATPWQILTTTPAALVNQIMEISDPSASAYTQRFYKVETIGPQ